MSEKTPAEVPATALGPMRTLAVRITDGLRAQLDVIAQLNDRSVTEEIRIALEAWVETTGRGGGRFLARAAAAVRLPGGYGGPELREAAMLMIPETALPQVGVAPMRSIAWHRVGAACRICPEPACPARSEPSILSEAG